MALRGADLYHQRYWNQVVREIMEPPFTVRAARTSLNVGKLVYGPDESVDIRARLRDAEGRPIVTPKAEALLYKEGKKVATVQLAGDENAAGLFQGQVKDLAGGTYEVRVPARRGAPEPDGSVCGIQVQQAGELAVLNANEDPLRQVAAQSGANSSARGSGRAAQPAGAAQPRAGVSKATPLSGRAGGGSPPWWRS